MLRKFYQLAALVAITAAAAAPTGCDHARDAELRLPDPDSTEAWFGSDAEVRLDGRVLEISGTLPEGFLERGGVIWQRSGPYFFIFNVHMRELIQEYPDLAAIRAIVHDDSGQELARATLPSGTLTEGAWDEGVRLASRAQTEGTENPRRIEQLIEWAEDRTEYEYAD